MNIFSVACLTTLLAGCSLLPTRTVYEVVLPPADLLVRCEPPALVRVETVRQAALLIVDLRESWAVCNAHHDALINWIIAYAE